MKPKEVLLEYVRLIGVVQDSLESALQDAPSPQAGDVCLAIALSVQHITAFAKHGVEQIIGLQPDHRVELRN